MDNIRNVEIRKKNSNYIKEQFEKGKRKKMQALR